MHPFMDRYFDESKYGRAVISIGYFLDRKKEGERLARQMTIEDLLEGMDLLALVPDVRFEVPDDPRIIAISDHPSFFYSFNDGREFIGTPASISFLGKRRRFRFPDGTTDPKTPYRFIQPDGIFRAPANESERMMSNMYRTLNFARYDQK
jgi:hypothetical protein